MIETIPSMCSPNNMHQRWDPILAALSVLNMYIFHDFLNGLDANTLCTVH